MQIEVKIEVNKAKQNLWRKFDEPMKTKYVKNQRMFYCTLMQHRQKKSYTMKNIKGKPGKY